MIGCFPTKKWWIHSSLFFYIEVGDQPQTETDISKRICNSFMAVDILFDVSRDKGLIGRVRKNLLGMLQVGRCCQLNVAVRSLETCRW